MKKIITYVLALLIFFGCQSNLFAYSYVGVMKGLIKGAYVKYKDVDKIAITSGYGECNGNYFEITSDIDHAMTSVDNDADFHYIYIDDNTSSYPTPTIIDSTDEPSWSDAKQGWYYGNDRCIGVVWSAYGTSDISIFSNDTLLRHNCYIKKVLDNGNPNGAWQSLSISDYVPVNVNAFRVVATNSDPGSYARLMLSTSMEYGGRLAENGSNDVCYLSGWLNVGSRSSWNRSISWCGDDNDNSNFDIDIIGYQIDR